MSIDVFKLPVFPAADVFPMMADDELRELAEDIKENGVREPVVIASGQLVDGRNRRAACNIAGVVPPVRELPADQDPTLYVVSANIHRRHMSKGQRAMATAFIFPKPEEKGRGKKSKLNIAFSPMLLSQARTVLAHSRTLATAVLLGTRSLTDAYQEAMIATGKYNNESKRLRELRFERPDLADAVEADEVSQRITLDEAFRKAAADAEQRKSQRWALTRNLIDGVRGLERDVEQSEELAREYDPACAEGFGEKITPERLRRVAAFASALAEHMEKVNA